jgi:hypothetical protein
MGGLVALAVLGAVVVLLQTGTPEALARGDLPLAKSRVCVADRRANTSIRRAMTSKTGNDLGPTSLLGRA